MTEKLRSRGLEAAYDRAAGWWHHRLSSMGFVAAYEGLAQVAVRGAGGALHVLDVGCGTGALSEAWVAQGGLAAGGRLDLLDPSAEMLRCAGERLEEATPRLIEAGVGASMGGRRYDVILCAHVLEHLEDPSAGLDWINAHLNPGGALVLAVSKPHWCTALVRLRWGSTAWRPGQVSAMLQAAGFEHVDMRPFQSGPPSRLSCGYVAVTGA